MSGGNGQRDPLHKNWLCFNSHILASMEHLAKKFEDLQNLWTACKLSYADLGRQDRIPRKAKEYISYVQDKTLNKSRDEVDPTIQSCT